MSKTTKEAPWDRYDITRKEWENLTPEARRKKRYDRWYVNNRKKRNDARRRKYKEDDEHRERVLEACKSRRPAARAEKADDKFSARVEAAQQRALEQSDDDSEESSAGGGRKGLPRCVEVAGKEMWVHTSYRLAQLCGRGQSTIRAWLAQGVLPGCTIPIKDRYYFSDAFINATREACRLVYYENGNGSREVLTRLVLVQLSKAKCSYVPPGGNENDRVYP